MYDKARGWAIQGLGRMSIDTVEVQTALFSIMVSSRLSVHAYNAEGVSDKRARAYRTGFAYRSEV